MKSTGFNFNQPQLNIYEKELSLTDDERNTLLFLTGRLRIIKVSELSDSEINNLKMFFGNHILQNETLQKVIIFKNYVILKVKTGKK